MPSQELNAMIMRAVTDGAFRAEFLANPLEIARNADASGELQAELEALDMEQLREQFEHLSQFSNDIVTLEAANHSKDDGGGNIHDKDGGIHDKNSYTEGTTLNVMEELRSTSFSDFDRDALREALKDPIIRKEFDGDPALNEIVRSLGI